jgi:cellulose synthase/poly-beta-1,6-N-acetylglucosamine synthase-like glycosyltransferase
MELIFWISLLVLFYSYLGYGLILLLGRFIAGKKAVLDNGLLPAVTVIVPAFNEESMIDQKIQNCLSLHYPSDRLFFLFITDGSSDSTPQRVAAFPLIQHLHLPERSGKTAALNRAMQQVQTPVVVFTDANTLLQPDSIKKMVRHYRGRSCR